LCSARSISSGPVEMNSKGLAPRPCRQRRAEKRLRILNCLSAHLSRRFEFICLGPASRRTLYRALRFVPSRPIGMRSIARPSPRSHTLKSDLRAREPAAAPLLHHLLLIIRIRPGYTCASGSGCRRGEMEHTLPSYFDRPGSWKLPCPISRALEPSKRSRTCRVANHNIIFRRPARP
jgi:hypothetical protein